LWSLTGGESFATDHSNASRTQLFNTETLQWDDELCALFGVPKEALPEVKASDSRFGILRAGATALPGGVPVVAMMGDSHAALYGHGIRTPGQVKATYGTGSSLMALTPRRLASRHGLSGTIAWSTGADVVYAMEGNITVSAQAAAFMATMLGLPDAAALSDLAQTVPDTGGVTFLPALAGLGAPHWDDTAKGALEGLTLGSTPAHVARATFEAIALQVCDVFTAMEADIGTPLESLHADGGASANGFLMQLQADLLGRDILRSHRAEIGALGVAKMAFAGLGIGFSEPQEETAGIPFSPTMPKAERAAILARWHAAIARVKAAHGNET
jgi:glycerol kinase